MFRHLIVDVWALETIGRFEQIEKRTTFSRLAEEATFHRSYYEKASRKYAANLQNTHAKVQFQ